MNIFDESNDDVASKFDESSVMKHYYTDDDYDDYDDYYGYDADAEKSVMSHYDYDDSDLSVMSHFG